MYWIIFAIFTTVETFTDIFLCWLVSHRYASFCNNNTNGGRGTCFKRYEWILVWMRLNTRKSPSAPGACRVGHFLTWWCNEGTGQGKGPEWDLLRYFLWWYCLVFLVYHTHEPYTYKEQWLGNSKACVQVWNLLLLEMQLGRSSAQGKQSWFPTHLFFLINESRNQSLQN